MNKKRLHDLDAIRILACFLVCLCHAPMPTGHSSMWITTYNYISCTCIGLFFMVSGALILPVKTDVGTFIRRRFIRLLIPTAFWSAVLLIVFYSMGKCSLYDATKAFCLVPISPVHGVYWFIYTIMGLYLAAPIISPALKNEKLVLYYLTLWAITLALPYMNAFRPNYWSFSGNLYHPLHEFNGYMGYMILGYYLRHHVPTLRTYLTRICLPCGLISFAIPLYFYIHKHPHIPNGSVYAYLTVNIAALCIIFFIGMQLAVKNIPRGGVGIFLQDLSSKCFGIYLIHIVVMRDFLWNIYPYVLPNTGYAIQIPVVAIGTFVCSYLIIKLVSYLPGSKYIL